MRTENIQPKIADEEKLPKNLVQFFSEVHQLIEEGHEVVTTSSDDLIQAEFAYGGLMEDGGDRFSFTFFPAEGTQPSWNFELTASEITAIARGTKKTLPLWRCRTSNCGNRFASKNGLCGDCDFIDDEREKKALVLEEIRACRSREDWVREYLRHFPNAHALHVMGDYNAETKLPKRWRPFSFTEIQALVKKFQNE